MIPARLALWWGAHWFKVAAAGLVLAAVTWWHLHEVSKSYRRGAEEKSISMLKDEAERVEAANAEKEKEFQARKAGLDAQQSAIATARVDLQTQRRTINEALSASLNQIETRGIDIRNEIHDLPDAAVNARFRTALDRARAAERERAAQP